MTCSNPDCFDGTVTYRTDHLVVDACPDCATRDEREDRIILRIMLGIAFGLGILAGAAVVRS